MACHKTADICTYICLLLYANGDSSIVVAVVNLVGNSARSLRYNTANSHRIYCVRHVTASVDVAVVVESVCLIVKTCTEVTANARHAEDIAFGCAVELQIGSVGDVLNGYLTIIDYAYATAHIERTATNSILRELDNAICGVCQVLQY